jgi:hypothetical protein
MKKESTLLLVDALINLALGIPLTFFPKNLGEFLGIPVPVVPFYASLLGAVLIGIGLALLVERSQNLFKLTGLGLGGAIVINLCGAGALSVWLLSGKLDIPLRGFLFLGCIAILVFCVAFIEGVSRWRKS